MREPENTPTNQVSGAGTAILPQTMPAGPGRLPIRRAANAFVVDFTDSRLVRVLVANYARVHGGVWVGGDATITVAALEFRANAGNRLLHGGRGDLVVELQLIQDIAIQRALVSDIIVVRAPNAVIQLRCFRAYEFAADLWAAAAQARLATGDPTPLPRVRESSESVVATEIVELLRRLPFQQ